MYPNSQFYLALPTNEHKQALGKPTVRASIYSSQASKHIVDDDLAIPKSTQPAHTTTNQVRSIQQHHTAREIKNTKISLRRAEERCYIRCMNATMRICQLENSNKALETQLEHLTAQFKALTSNNDQPKCADCSAPYLPAKKNYKKCRECFLSLKSKLCKNCSRSFKPKHHSYRYCPCCSKK